MIVFVEIFILIVACRLTLTNTSVQILMPGKYKIPSNDGTSIVKRSKTATTMTVHQRAVSRLRMYLEQKWLRIHIEPTGSMKNDEYNVDRIAESCRMRSSPCRFTGTTQGRTQPCGCSRTDWPSSSTWSTRTWRPPCSCCTAAIKCPRPITACTTSTHSTCTTSTHSTCTTRSATPPPTSTVCGLQSAVTDRATTTTTTPSPKPSTHRCPFSVPDGEGPDFAGDDPDKDDEDDDFSPTPPAAPCCTTTVCPTGSAAANTNARLPVTTTGMAPRIHRPCTCTAHLLPSTRSPCLYYQQAAAAAGLTSSSS